VRVTKSHPPAQRGSAAPASVSDGHPSFTRDDLPIGLQRALDVAIDKSARAPVILQVTDITGYTDWVLLVSGRSDRHVSAIADAINRALRDEEIRPRGTDGFGDHTWDLLDYDEFMVHVFYHPVRMHYDLESMWSDAPRVTLDLPPEVMDTTDLEALETPTSLPEYRGDFMFGGFADEFENAQDELGELIDDDADDAHEVPDDDD
jgi:ribosome silencing factor RsfS/YbeB/iojap